MVTAVIFLKVRFNLCELYISPKKTRPKNPKKLTNTPKTKKHKGQLLNKNQDLSTHERHLDLLDYGKTNKCIKTTPNQCKTG